MTKPRSIFFMVTGPYRNVGDSLIRRRALAWARDFGSLVLMLSGSPSSDWEQSLEIRDEDVVIRSKYAWLRKAIRAGKRPVLVIEPGEFNTDRRFYPSLAFVLVVSVLVRLRGGTVVQMPRSLAMRSRAGDLAYRLILGRTEPLWREQDSLRHFGLGSAGPDIGFDHVPVPDDQARDVLAVSLRGDRPPPGPEWSQGVKAFATEVGLRIVVLSQVESDNGRCVDLAAELGGEADIWGVDVSSESRERHVRASYRRTAVILSDRLHALVIGAVEGASPVEIVPSPNGKARRHFAAIGIDATSFDANELSSDLVRATLVEVLANKHETRQKVQHAAAMLSALRSQMNNRLDSHGAR